MEREEAERLVAQYGSAVYRLAYARTGSREDAEDVTQETFLRLVRSSPVFQDGAHEKAWLLRVAAHCAADVFRAPWRKRDLPLEAAAGASVPPPEEPDGSVLSAVLALPEKYRLPVHLFYYEGYSIKEAAAILGRREMDRVELSPDQRARIVQAMVEEPPRKQRRRPPVRLLVAAALVCGVLTTSALALSPTLRDYLAQALGSFTSYSREPEGAAAADQNIEIRVVSAVTDQYRMKIYVEAQDLTGEYFTDDRILMWWKIPREWGGASVSSVPYAIAYDPETHTALFELDMSGYRRAEVNEELELTVDWIQAGQMEVETTEVLPVELLSDQYLETMTLDNGDMVLVPEQTPAELEGTDLFRLSSLGFAPDGTLQAIFELSQELAEDDSILLGKNELSFTALVDGELPFGEDTEWEHYSFTWNGRPYVGCGQKMPLTDKDRVTLSNVSGGLTRHISGPWTISFPVENIPVKEIELTGDIGEWSYPTTFAISPLGAMMTGSIDVGSWGNGPFAVIYEDGTRFEDVTVRHSIFTPGELCVLGNWEFTEPLDLDRAVAVEIGDWHIPLTGPEAGVVRPQ